MRSDRDERTETEREIDDFLSKFEPPADELSADISTYIEKQNNAVDEQNEANTAPSQTFSWKKVVDPEFVEVQEKSSEADDINNIQGIPDKVNPDKLNNKVDYANLDNLKNLDNLPNFISIIALA